MKSVAIATLAHCAFCGITILCRKADRKWSGGTTRLFDRRHGRERFVIIDLEAVWCQWCHVMEKDDICEPAGFRN